MSRLTPSVESYTDAQVTQRLQTTLDTVHKLPSPATLLRTTKMPGVELGRASVKTRTLTKEELEECIHLLETSDLVVAASAMEVVAKGGYPSYERLVWFDESKSLTNIYSAVDPQYWDDVLSRKEYIYGTINAFRAIVRLMEASLLPQTSNESLMVLGGLGGVIFAAGYAVSSIMALAAGSVKLTFKLLARVFKSPNVIRPVAIDTDVQSFIDKLSTLDGMLVKKDKEYVKGDWISDLAFDGRFHTKDPMITIRQICKEASKYKALATQYANHMEAVTVEIDRLDKDLVSNWTFATAVESVDLSDLMVRRDTAESRRMDDRIREHLANLNIDQVSLESLEGALVRSPDDTQVQTLVNIGLEGLCRTYGLTGAPRGSLESYVYRSTVMSDLRARMDMALTSLSNQLDI